MSPEQIGSSVVHVCPRSRILELVPGPHVDLSRYGTYACTPIAGCAAIRSVVPLDECLYGSH
jgi:hypothetical protein